MIVTIRSPGLLFAHILVFPNFSQDLIAQNQLTSAKDQMPEF